MMRKTPLPFLISLLILVSAGCSHNDATPSMESKILGNWLVVDAQGNQFSTEWGFFYVGSVKLYADKSFGINHSTAVDVPNSPRQGTWSLIDNTLTLNSVMDNAGTI